MLDNIQNLLIETEYYFDDIFFEDLKGSTKKTVKGYIGGFGGSMVAGVTSAAGAKSVAGFSGGASELIGSSVYAGGLVATAGFVIHRYLNTYHRISKKVEKFYETVDYYDI